MWRMHAYAASHLQRLRANPGHATAEARQKYLPVRECVCLSLRNNEQTAQNIAAR